MVREVHERRQVELCGATEEEVALAHLRDAVDFFDRVVASSDDEKIAVGTDHYDGLIAAARRAAFYAPLLID